MDKRIANHFKDDEITAQLLNGIIVALELNNNDYRLWYGKNIFGITILNKKLGLESHKLVIGTESDEVYDVDVKTVGFVDVYHGKDVQEGITKFLELL